MQITTDYLLRRYLFIGTNIKYARGTLPDGAKYEIVFQNPLERVHAKRLAPKKEDLEKSALQLCEEALRKRILRDRPDAVFPELNLFAIDPMSAVDLGLCNINLLPVESRVARVGAKLGRRGKLRRWPKYLGLTRNNAIDFFKRIGLEIVKAKDQFIPGETEKKYICGTLYSDVFYANKIEEIVERALEIENGTVVDLPEEEAIDLTDEEIEAALPDLEDDDE